MLDQENTAGSYVVVVQLVPDSGFPEGRDAFAQRPFFALEPFGLGFPGSELEQKPLHQRGHLCVPLGRCHAGPPTGFVIQ